MSTYRQAEILREQFKSFKPDHNSRARYLAFFAATIAIADTDLIGHAAQGASDAHLSREHLYEVILQSYLFLGFPRMLIAMDTLNIIFPRIDNKKKNMERAEKSYKLWLERGAELCKKIYDSNYERLKNRVESISPEVFHWMIYEGYGKVLARPALNIKDRELCIVAQLLVENRPVQLHSHIRGALNVGVSPVLISDVINDLGKVNNDGHRAAVEIMNNICQG